MLVLDAGDYSMGTAFGAASRETGGELQVMSLMGYDATTFGNHEFDLGPDGLARSDRRGRQSRPDPRVLASNTNFLGADTTLAGLQHLRDDGLVRRHVVIERGGIRFGLFGVLGKEAQFYTTGAGAVTFADFIGDRRGNGDASPRDGEGGCRHLPQPRRGGKRQGWPLSPTATTCAWPGEVPGIDVVIGGHSHTELHEAIIVNDRTPVVQTGKEGRKPRRARDHFGWPAS